MPGSSSSSMRPPTDPDREVDEIAEEYLDQLLRGEKPDRGALLQAHPEISDLLDRKLTLMEMMWQARSTGGDGGATKTIEPPGRAPRMTGDSEPADSRSWRASAEDEFFCPSDEIGPYKILERIGQGGMGNVYLADQAEPIRRQVALKVIRLGMDTEETLARFETERQALAMMDHPNIAKVFDAGVTDRGRPFFVMEHVPGQPLTRYCDSNRLPTRERLELIIDVCEAVHHAHQKGIIHRDLKPSNILVTATNGDARAKIIDFGIAKATRQRLAEHAVYTELGRIVGTPEYMSPEQANPLARDIDTRSDIYTLGVVLYELLVGALPFDSNDLRGTGLPAIQRQIRETDPPKPSTRISTLGEISTEIAIRRRTTAPSLRRTLRGDLDWITMKALERDRTRRYQSASELAADIRRYLNDEPVLAGSPSLRYRFGKLARRHRVAFGFSAALVLLMVGGLLGMSALYLEADREREGKEKQAKKAEALRFLLERMVTPTDPSATRGYRDIRLADILERSSKETFENPPEDMEVRAEFHRILGRSYRFLAQYRRAEEHLAAAYKIYEEHLGFDSVDSLRVMLDWAIIRDRLGHSAGAAKLFERVYERRRELLEPDDPLVHDGARAVGINLRVRRRMEECRVFSEKAVAECRLWLGDDHVMTGHLLFTLSIALRELGRLDEAMEVTREVLKIYGLPLEENEAQHVRARHGLAALHLRRGEIENCYSIISEVLRIQERRHGKDHPIALAARTLWAQALLARGEAELAEESLTTVQGVYQDRGEERRPRALLVRHHLARAQVANDKTELAEETLRAGRQLAAGATDLEYPTVVLTTALGGLLLQKGRFEEAAPLLREAWELAGESPHLTTGERSGIEGVWGACLVRQGKNEEAGPLLRRALEGIDRASAGELGHERVVLDALLRLSEQEGETAAASSYRRRLEELEE